MKQTNKCAFDICTKKATVSIGNNINEGKLNFCKDCFKKYTAHLEAREKLLIEQTLRINREDRIETTYDAIDEMVFQHGKPRPDKFGGGKWNKDEELAIYIKQVGPRYTSLQWSIILSYARQKGFDIDKVKKIEKC